MPSDRANVANRLSQAAAAAPDRLAVVARTKRGTRNVTFAQLDADATAAARGLVELGVRGGTRVALLVPPSPEFVTLAFALLRSGATTIFIDPGMGRKPLVECLAAAEPEGFVAVSRAQAVRVALRRRFPRAKLNVTVGRRWFWGGVTYRNLLLSAQVRDNDMNVLGSAGGLHPNREIAERSPPAEPGAFISTTGPDDPAGIIFTSGSTGPPKGVLYTHRMFETQAAEIQRAYDIQPGGVDLSCFALFGLFNAAWGVTTVFPRVDFSRPAAADPRELLGAANEWNVSQAFASPAVWDKLSRHCEQTGASIPTLRKIFSCGAPVHAEVLRRTLACVPASGAEMHTPYGATEALPVSTIEAREVLGETAALTAKGAGVCVGRKFETIDWRVIRITDEPLANIDDEDELPPGEIGELIVRGPQVTPGYVVEALQPRALPGGRATIPPAINVSSDAQNPRAEPGAETWHRMGDVGCFDGQGRFWYHGRKSQRVETGRESLFTERCEAIFRAHPGVLRCALVGDGGAALATPVMVIESSLPELAGQQTGKLSRDGQSAWDSLVAELFQLGAQHECTAAIGEFLLHPSLPVDVRHNSKINREALAAWATRMIADHKLRPHRTKPHVLSLKPPASSLQPPA